MKRTILAVAVLLACAVVAFAATHQSERSSGNAPAGNEVDTTHVVTYSLQVGGPEATVFYHVSAPSWQVPLNWSISVVSQGDTLLRKSGDSRNFDADFAEIMRGCQSRLECKKEWVREDLLSLNVDTLEVGSDQRSYYREHGFIEDAASTFLIEKGWNQNEAKEAADSLKKAYRNRAMVTVYFNEHPVTGGDGLYVWHPELNRLLPVYY